MSRQASNTGLVAFWLNHGDFNPLISFDVRRFSDQLFASFLEVSSRCRVPAKLETVRNVSVTALGVPPVHARGRSSWGIAIQALLTLIRAGVWFISQQSRQSLFSKPISKLLKGGIHG